MSDFEDAIHIAAPAEEVWQVVADVERWPEWTSSMTKITKVAASPLGVGSVVRIIQPRLPALTWTVDTFDQGRFFSWRCRSRGVSSVAEHRVTPAEGGTEVHLAVRQSGPMAWLAALAYGRLTRNYLRTEVEGLKRRVEQASAPRME